MEGEERCGGKHGAHGGGGLRGHGEMGGKDPLGNTERTEGGGLRGHGEMEGREKNIGRHGAHGGGGLREQGEEGRNAFENMEDKEHADSESGERGKKMVLRKLE